jgi:hypothetical protein
MFVTRHLWEYKNVSLKGRFPLCPGSVQDNFHCILMQMQFTFFFNVGRPKRRWVVNIKMDLQEVGGGCVDWM